MSETAVPEEGAVIGGEQPTAAKRQLDPGFSRNLRIVGGGMVVGLLTIAGVVYFFSGGNKSNLPAQSSIQVRDGAQASSDGLTPAMREKLARAQAKEAEGAARRGESYIPPDVLPSSSNVEASIPQSQQQQQQRYSEAEVQANAAAVQAINERNRARLAAAQQMLSSTLTRPDVERVGIAQSTASANSSSAGANSAVPATTAQASASDASRDEVLIADMMEIFGARLTSPLDTDSSTFASAEITTGKLAGAYLIGQVRLAGEGVQLEFTGMRHKNVTYPISAIGLDQATSTSAVQGDLDRKLLQRYVFPVLMAYTGAYATARAQVPVTSVAGAPSATAATVGSVVGSVLDPGGANSTAANAGAVAGAVAGGALAPGGGVLDYTVNRPSPTAAQARSAGIASAVATGNRVTAKMAAEPIRVSMPNGASIGIMFRQPVVASAAVTPAAAR